MGAYLRRSKKIETHYHMKRSCAIFTVGDNNEEQQVKIGYD